LGEEGKDVLLKVLISVVEGEGDRTSVDHVLFPFHRIQGIIDRQELKIVLGEIFELFFEGMKGEPEPVNLGCGAHVLILDDGEFLQSHGRSRMATSRFSEARLLQNSQDSTGGW